MIFSETKTEIETGVVSFHAEAPISVKMQPAILVIAVILLCSFSISSIVVAEVDGDNPCQSQDSTSISLGSWLLVYGLVNICFFMLLGLSSLLSRIWDMDWGPAERWFLRLLNTLQVFYFCWCVVGIVLLARSNGQCLTDGAPIGSMVLADLIVWFFVLCGVNGSRDD